MDVTEITNFISNTGFAIAVAIYSLTRLEKTMKENTAVMHEVLNKLKEEDKQ